MTSAHTAHTSLAPSYGWICFTLLIWVEIALGSMVLSNCGLITRNSSRAGVGCGLAIAVGLPLGELHNWWRVSIPQHYYVYVVALVTIATVAVGIEQLIRFAVARRNTSN